MLGEGFKSLFHEKRPDSNAHDSFPSGHATAAFAAAAAESDLHPHETALWFTGAALISYSRIRLHRHYGRDVSAGALLGYGTARLELSAPRGLIFIASYSAGLARLRPANHFAPALISKSSLFHGTTQSRHVCLLFFVPAVAFACLFLAVPPIIQVIPKSK